MTNADILFGLVILLVFMFIVLPLIGSWLNASTASYKEDMKIGALFVGVLVGIAATVFIVVASIAYFSGSLPEDSGLIKTINSW